MKNPKNFNDAKKEIERLRYEVKALWREQTKDSPLVKENADFLLDLLLYGDSRPGHEFDKI